VGFGMSEAICGVLPKQTSTVDEQDPAMRIRRSHLACGLCAVLLGASGAPAPTPAMAAGSSSEQWRAEVQSAPGREVLPMRPEQNIPEMLALANGDVVVAGTYDSDGNLNEGHLAVAELLPDGRFDPSFADQGVELTGFKLQPWQILTQPDGKILVFGPSRAPGTGQPRITRFPNWQVLRLLPDGQPDPGFGRGGLMVVSGVPVPTESSAHAVAPELAPNGDMLLPTVLGTLFTPTMTSGLARLNPDGSRDTSFGTNGVVQLPPSLEAFAVDAKGSPVAAFYTSSGALLLRLDLSGKPDPTFNGGSPLQTPPGYIFDSLLVEPDGSIELAGHPSAIGVLASSIWRYTRVGALDVSWGSGGRVDLTSGYGLINQLLPESDGGTLLVMVGSLTSMKLGSVLARITRLTSVGRFDPSTGPNGVLVTLPFGGGTYTPGSVANLHQNTFASTGVIQRAGGSLLFNGTAEAAEQVTTDAGTDWLAGIVGFAIAALDPSYHLDPTFTGATQLRLAARVTSTRLRSSGIAMRLRSTHAALSVVTVTSAGMTIAKSTVRFFSTKNAVHLATVRIPLTGAGRHLARQHRRRITIAVKVSGVDLAGSHATARATARLAN
jgi:uncharacterized delta-60 repeat protein